jgi:hypothetical protein
MVNNPLRLITSLLHALCHHDETKGKSNECECNQYLVGLLKLLGQLKAAFNRQLPPDLETIGATISEFENKVEAAGKEGTNDESLMDRLRAIAPTSPIQLDDIIHTAKIKNHRVAGLEHSDCIWLSNGRIGVYWVINEFHYCLNMYGESRGAD